MTREEPVGTPGLGETLQRITEAVLVVGALRTATRIDLFGRLAQTPLDTFAVAAACGLSERGARHLLAAAASLGLLACDEAGRYRSVVPDLAALDRMLDVLDGVAQTIRTGQPAVIGDTSAGACYAESGQFGDLLYGSAAERCAAYLAKPGMRLLQLGAGTAVWSRAIAHRIPDALVTVVDLPPAGGRAWLDSDLFAAAWPGRGGFDLVLVPTLCHLFAPEQNAWLLARAAGALRPGGRVAVIDVLADQHDAASASVALYALGLLSRTAAGEVYSFATYVQWLRASGLNAIERHELGGRPPLSLVEGTYSL